MLDEKLSAVDIAKNTLISDTDFEQDVPTIDDFNNVKNFTSTRIPLIQFLVDERVSFTTIMMLIACVSFAATFHFEKSHQDIALAGAWVFSLSIALVMTLWVFVIKPNIRKHQALAKSTGVDIGVSCVAGFIESREYALQTIANAKKGCHNAVYELFDMYRQGIGVKQNYKLAISLAKISAQAHSRDGALALARHYQYHGTEQQWFDWLNVAAELGSLNAKRKVHYLIKRN